MWTLKSLKTALLTILVVLFCCTVAFVGLSPAPKTARGPGVAAVACAQDGAPATKTARLVALSPAPKTGRLVSSALAPPGRHVLIFSMIMMSTPPTPRGPTPHGPTTRGPSPLPAGPRETTPPHGSAPPVQGLVARALQKSMVNQTTLALTAMAPKHSAPVPLKVYQASFVVKVRVASLRPCPSVWAAAE